MAGEVLSDKQIKMLIEGGAILNADIKLVNPASLDLRLSRRAWRLLGSTLPLPEQKVEEILVDIIDFIQIEKFGEHKKFYADLNQPYLFELVESLDLPNSLSARVFNKSGRGRIGTSVKVLSDYTPSFNHIRRGYKGKLYAEVCATVFPEIIYPGETSMPQIRFYDGEPESLKGSWLELLLRNQPILLDSDNNPVKFSSQELEKICSTGKLTFTTDFSKDLLVYKARKDSRIIDLSQKNFYDPEDFFEEVRVSNGKRLLIIHPGEFVLIKSKEKIRLPPTHAAEIAEYYAEIGDLKCHYAGLINPGHGYEEGKITGANIMFEVRARDIPIILQDDQPLAQFELYKMSEIPEIDYMKVRSTDYDSLPSILPVQFKRN